LPVFPYNDIHKSDHLQDVVCDCIFTLGSVQCIRVWPCWTDINILKKFFHPPLPRVSHLLTA